MGSTDQTTIIKACARAAVRIFTPLVRMLLRHGIPYKTVAEWLRWCYAQVAFEEFAPPDRKQSKTRVAVISGLTRIDVDRLLSQPSPAQADSYKQYQRAAMVLAGWVGESDHDSAVGGELPYEGEASFATLVERYSKGATPRAILDELVGNQCVEQLSNGRVKLLRREYASHSGDVEAEFDILGHAAGSLVHTIAHNTAPQADETWLQGLAFNSAIPVDQVDPIAAHIKQRARELLYEIDDYLTQQAKTANTDQQDVVEAGLGMHFFINDVPSGHDQED